MAHVGWKAKPPAQTRKFVSESRLLRWEPAPIRTLPPGLHILPLLSTITFGFSVGEEITSKRDSLQTRGPARI